MPPIPEITDRNETERQIAGRMEELTRLMQEADRLRHRQFLVSVSTILLMLVILTLFILDQIVFFRTYPKRLLMQEVIRQNRVILGNPYHFGTRRKYDRELVRYFIRSMRKELQKRKPDFLQEIRTEIRSLQEYAAADLRKTFQQELYSRLQAESRLCLTEQKIHPNARQISLLRQVNLKLAAAATDRLFGNPDRTGNGQTFARVQEEAGFLRQSQMYRELAEEPLEAVEDRMFENLLECLVCRLNESKAQNGKDHD